MNLSINGNPREISVPMTLGRLLGELGLERERVAVELNLQILPRERFDETLLAEGDSLEIVQFVGGG